MIAASNLNPRPVSDVAIKRAGSSQPWPQTLTKRLQNENVARMNAIRPMLRTLKAGETLYFQGDECRNVHVLLDGWAFRHRSLEDGRRQILDFALPGVVFGLAAKGVVTHSVETLTPCTFSVFSRDRLFELFHAVPALSLCVVELMADAETRAFEHLTSVGRRTARERVANLLLELLQRARDAQPTKSVDRVALPLMQPHIADALGLASETVCRVLAAMRKDGILILRGRKLEVLDMQRMTKEAGVEPESPAVRGRPVHESSREHAGVARIRIRAAISA